ncbi:Z1 domain-containing protein [Corynebacterium bovis]
MPEGYFGTEQVFGRDALPSEDPDEISDDVHDIIREIPEDELNEVRPPSRNINAWNPAVPESLSQAIRWFLLATATRRLRGDAGKHSSMLIHTSSRTDAHEALASEVDAEIRSVREGIRTGQLRDDLRTQWESETGLNPLNPDCGEPPVFRPGVGGPAGRRRGPRDDHRQRDVGGAAGLRGEDPYRHRRRRQHSPPLSTIR